MIAEAVDTAITLGWALAAWIAALAALTTLALLAAIAAIWKASTTAWRLLRTRRTT
ncbi:hypothetical protein ACH4VM_02805 [Streptomyces sp. NPDC020792]|uniref:hypothetical protein n=1 Tax=Streptomyces sp. NPDC020792 TaxID=3365089 RepID=UPI0037917F40